MRMCVPVCWSSASLFFSELVETWSAATAVWSSKMHILLLQIRFERTKEKLSPLSVCQQPPSILMLCFFKSWLQLRHAPQSVGVITVECRLLWRGLAPLTGFGTAACRASARLSRRAVRRQRVSGAGITQFGYFRCKDTHVSTLNIQRFVLLLKQRGC